MFVLFQIHIYDTMYIRYIFVLLTILAGAYKCSAALLDNITAKYYQQCGTNLPRKRVCDLANLFSSTQGTGAICMYSYIYLYLLYLYWNRKFHLKFVLLFWQRIIFCAILASQLEGLAMNETAGTCTDCTQQGCNDNNNKLYVYVTTLSMVLDGSNDSLCG